MTIYQSLYQTIIMIQNNNDLNLFLKADMIDYYI